jgi:hypothetical protein
MLVCFSGIGDATPKTDGMLHEHVATKQLLIAPDIVTVFSQSMVTTSAKAVDAKA